MKFDFSKAVFLIFLIIAFGLCARIFDTRPLVIAFFDSVLFLLMMIVLCLVMLFVGRRILSKFLGWVDGTTKDGTKSSIFPILSVFMNLVIVLTFTYVIMDHFGFDLMVIVTSLGLVGLAISFGAQSTLQQFFSGIGMMFAGTIRTGDVIHFPDSDDKLIVKSIGVMTTTFESMERPELIIMPNSVISESVLHNMTAQDSHYEIHLEMHFKTGTRSLLEVRDALVESAYGIEHVIADETYEPPRVEFMGFDGCNVKTKVIVALDDVHYFDTTVSDLILSVSETLRKLDLLPNWGMDIQLEEVKHGCR